MRFALAAVVLTGLGCALLDSRVSAWSGSAGASRVESSPADAGEQHSSGRVIARSEQQAAEGQAFDFSGPALWARWNALRGDGYELDRVERFLEKPTKRLQCDRSNLVTYSGTAIRYRGAVTVNVPFRERLERFENVVAETAQEVYGRAPRTIVHFGAYSCRSSRNRSRRVSEHALGNAIDIAGFDFGAAPKSSVLPAELPRQLRGPFQVRVAKHWNPKKNVLPGIGTASKESSTQSAAALHARFLHLLTERLIDRPEIFRGMIGPSRADHSDHLHFDVSPWRYVRL